MHVTRERDAGTYPLKSRGTREKLGSCGYAELLKTAVRCVTVLDEMPSFSAISWLGFSASDARSLLA
jgi:hypothetical protein